MAWLLLLAWLLPLRAPGGGLPEPDLVLYGTIRDVNGGLNVRLTAGTLSWTFQPAVAGLSVVVTVGLTNINDQFSYAVRIPCEAIIGGFPASAGTLRLGGVYDRSQISVDGRSATFVHSSQQTLTLTSTDRGRIERVDLEVAIGGSELLPESWQLQYFGRTGIDPLDDPDNDGMNNLGEYRAGTNPLDPSSVFAIEIIEDALGGPHLTWQSVLGMVYTLQRSEDLFTGFADLAVDISATPPLNDFRDVRPASGGTYFYRLSARRVAQ